jgi:hypothetical protein
MHGSIIAGRVSIYGFCVLWVEIEQPEHLQPDTSVGQTSITR